MLLRSPPLPAFTLVDVRGQGLHLGEAVSLPVDPRCLQRRQSVPAPLRHRLLALRRRLLPPRLVLALLACPATMASTLPSLLLM